MLYKKFYLLLLLCINSGLHSQEFSFSTHGLIMILDAGELWSNNGNLLSDPQSNDSLATTYNLLRAVNRENQPIIITKKSYCALRLLKLYGSYAINNDQSALLEIESTLQVAAPYLNAFRLSDTKRDELAETLRSYHNSMVEFSKTKIFTPQYSNLFAQYNNAHYGFFTVLGGYYNFYPTNWHIRDIGSNLLLLMPKKIYINDLQSGIALTSFPDVSKKPLSELAQEAKSGQNAIVQSILGCFVSSSAYKTFPQPVDNTPIPTWTIYINGHGNTGNKTYALLKPKELAQLIKKLNTTISLKLFTLNACFLKKDVTDQLENLLRQEFQQSEYAAISSIIAFGGISESFTAAMTSFVPEKLFSYSRSKKSVIVNTTLVDFTGFFEDLKSGQPIDFEKTLNKIFLYQTAQLNPFNIPLIRFPNSEIFTPLQAPSMIGSIGSVLAKTRNPKTPLNVNTFFNTRKSQVCSELIKIILLYTPFIPFQLEMHACKNSDFPYILSMINTPITYLRGLILDGFDPESALRSLFKIDENNKIYIIGEISVQKKSSSDPSSTIVERVYKNVVLVKGETDQLGYKPGIYLTNTANEESQYIYSNSNWVYEVKKHAAFTTFMNAYNSNLPQLPISLLDDSSKQSIEEALAGKLSNIAAAKYFYPMSNDFSILSQLL